MKTINSTKYFNFFLGGRIKVTNLSSGAKLYGGATKLDDSIYSNIESDNFIRLYDNKENRMSLVVPSTLDIDSKIDNMTYVNKYFNLLAQKYDKIELLKTQGSWYSDDLCKTVIEDVTLLTIVSKNASENDIMYLKQLAEEIKFDMNQEGVSIFINDSLAIV